MSIDYITDKCAKIVRKHGTRNPFRVAMALGIEIIYMNDLTTSKGVYKVIKRNRFIFINANLPERTQKIVCAHELGHDQFHRHLAKGDGLAEFMLYDMDSRPEYEANIFAADFLLDDDEVLDLIYTYNYDVEQIACQLHSDINLVALKCSNLSNKGYDLRSIEHRSDFLK